jgi:hypothetical protein
MMMNARSLIISTLLEFGYTKGAGGVIRKGSEITTIFDPGTSRKNGLFSVSAGIWINCLGSDYPKRFWNCHIYGGVGCLFPAMQDTFVHMSSSINSEKYRKSLEDSVRLLAMRSEGLSKISQIREAFLRGDFSRCLILKDARHFLELT